MIGWSWWRKVVLLVPLVAGAFAAQHAGPSGFPVAEGCSGHAAVYTPGWQYLRIAGLAEQERVEVATDGFVVLQGAFNGDEIELEAAEIEVTASLDGGTVPGTLQLLRGEVFPGHAIAHWGWQADATLPMGSVVHLTFGIANGVEPSMGAVTLDVVTEPHGLPTPVASLGSWLDYRRGVGELVECQTEGGYFCAYVEPETIQVPEQEVRHVANGTIWEAPAITGMVAWEARAELSGPLGDAVVNEESALVTSSAASQVHTGTVVFPSDAEEYCVVLTVADLRTGEEVHSEPVCGTPKPSNSSIRTHSLAECAEPPTPESKALWCEYHRGHALCATEPEMGSSGGAATGGAAGSDDLPTEDEDTASPGKDAHQDVESCQFAPGGSHVAATLLMSLLGLALARRRALSLRQPPASVKPSTRTFE